MDQKEAIEFIINRLEILQRYSFHRKCEKGTNTIGTQIRLLFSENEYKQSINILKEIINEL